MKWFLGLPCLLLFVASEPVGANPCVDPQRMVNGHTADLQPLMDWWSAPKGMRPLGAWKHVHGVLDRDTVYGWVVTGKVEGDAHSVAFLLKNPPRKKLARFHELQSQLAEYLRVRNAAMDFARRPVVTDWYSLWLSQWHSSPPISLMQYHDASSLLAELDKAIQGFHAELAPMQDRHGNFKLDAFALKLHEPFESLPVFDYGSTKPFLRSGALFDNSPDDPRTKLCRQSSPLSHGAACFSRN